MEDTICICHPLFLSRPIHCCSFLEDQSLLSTPTSPNSHCGAFLDDTIPSHELSFCTSQVLWLIPGRYLSLYHLPFTYPHGLRFIPKNYHHPHHTIFLFSSPCSSSFLEDTIPPHHPSFLSPPSTMPHS